MRSDILALAARGDVAGAASLVKASLASGSGELRPISILAAHLLFRDVAWDQITALLPPHTNGVVTSGWLNPSTRADR